MHHWKYGDAQFALWVHFCYWAKITRDKICQWPFLLRFPRGRFWRVNMWQSIFENTRLSSTSYESRQRHGDHHTLIPPTLVQDPIALRCSTSGRPSHIWVNREHQGWCLLGLKVRSLFSDTEEGIREERGEEGEKEEHIQEYNLNQRWSTSGLRVI